VLPTELVRGSDKIEGLQPVAGRFEIDGDTVWFVPRFAFLAGTSYSLLVRALDPAGTDDVEEWAIARPEPTVEPTTQVVAIYPTADELPVNQLRLYVHFSGQMGEGRAASAISVRRADTAALLDGVFLPLEPELWDRGRQRLTVLLDPGRIKRGLAPNVEVGYPLAEGMPIVVEIGQSFRDAQGLPLRQAAQRRYHVGPPVRTRVDPAGWSWRPPAAGSVEALIIRFDRPLDHALLEHCLSVGDAGGAPLAGTVTIGPGEQSWRFAPASPWKPGRHVLTVDARLEDLAGNSVGRVFDRDLTRIDQAPLPVEAVTLGFVCSGSTRSP
jgi:hypothetical protein